ncbi:MAG: sugar ABC transporter ATP-binding protein [Zavarzinella sp.]
MNQRAGELLEQVGLLASDARRIVGQLAPGQKQLVEIARALSMDARVIIMDEPTSSLTQKETDRLYEVIDQLRARGVGIIYISHRLAEVKRLADRVTVFRDGKNAGELQKLEISHDAMVSLMVGRDLANIYPHQSREKWSGVAALQVEDLTFEGGPTDGVSFRVQPGEIVGMAGLVGAGRTELAEAIFGIRRILQGKVTVQGMEVPVRRPSDLIQRGLLMAPEDRRFNGLVLEKSVRFNFALPNLDLFRRWLWLPARQEKQMTQEMIVKLNVKTPSMNQIVGFLSGGNQQKVVLGKWLARKPHVLILDEPTRGVDVGARNEIYQIMDQLAASGVGILMISSDMEEVLGMSDRILVLHEGQLMGELSRDQFREETVMQLATGNRFAATHMGVR